MSIFIFIEIKNENLRISETTSNSAKTCCVNICIMSDTV